MLTDPFVLSGDLFRSVEDFVEPAIKQCRLSANANAIKSLWKIMKPVVIDVNFIHRLNQCDTTGDDDSTVSHCQAAAFTLMQARRIHSPAVHELMAHNLIKTLTFHIVLVSLLWTFGCSFSRQVTPQEAKRSSKVVALLRHWVELQLLIHQQALEYRRTNEVPKGTHIQIGRRKS